MLFPLPYEPWAPTLTTLHLWLQIVGKIRLASSAHRNHWWNVPFHLTSTGVTTRVMTRANHTFEIAFDFIEGRCRIWSTHGSRKEILLHDGLSVAAFYESVFAALGDLGIDVPIRAVPYGMAVTTPFAQDQEHHSYDADAVNRWWRILLWSGEMFDEFSSSFAGKISPIHLFWHSLDLAVTRFSGRRAPDRPEASVVERVAYSHEVISFGFWPGDPSSPAPAYYTYTAPEPPNLSSFPLDAGAARWVERGSGHLGVLAYDEVRWSADPRGTLLQFLENGYRAGAVSASWDIGALTELFPPPPASAR